MSNWFSKLSLVSLMAFNATAWGWGPHHSSALEIPTEPPTIHFPLNENQAWFVKPTYVIWRPIQDGTDLGYKTEFVDFVQLPIENSTKIENLNFGWGSGVRLEIGRYLPKHDQWDVTLTMTYFYDDSDTTHRGSLADPSSINRSVGDTLLNFGWGSDLLGDGVSSKMGWQINYFTWDLLIGREYLLTRKLVMHPFLGARGVLIYEDYSLKNQFDGFLTSESDAIFPSSFKANNAFYGGGFRIGSDFSYNFGHGWSFLGSLSGSFIISRYDMEEKLEAKGTTSYFLKVEDAQTALRTNLEGNIGLGWEKWVRNHTVRLAPSFLFEVTEWYSINPWVGNMNFTGTDNPDVTLNSQRRKQRDLGFLGFSLNLQIDF